MPSKVIERAVPEEMAVIMEWPQWGKVRSPIKKKGVPEKVQYGLALVLYLIKKSSCKFLKFISVSLS